MSLAFVPLYIKFMGIESYGLVGIFVSLPALFGVLDMGLSTTLNRELTKAFSGTGQSPGDAQPGTYSGVAILGSCCFYRYGCSLPFGGRSAFIQAG